ncbi:hypothetical protein V6N13_015370 [Hibiscus sabdariffa]
MVSASISEKTASALPRLEFGMPETQSCITLLMLGLRTTVDKSMQHWQSDHLSTFEVMYQYVRPFYLTAREFLTIVQGNGNVITHAAAAQIA